MKKIVTGILLFVFLLLSGVFVFGCEGKKVQLDTPAVRIGATALEWDAVKNTRDYIVDIDGTEYPFSLEMSYHETRSVRLDFLTEYKTYTIKVKAKGSGKYTDSAYSPEVKFSKWSEGLQFLNIGLLSSQMIDDFSEYGVALVDADADVNVVVPEFYNGKPVSVIWPAGFSDFNKMESIVIPEGIKSIENNAFDHCYGLRSIIIPSTVEKIGELAFRSCNMTIYVRGYSEAPSGWHTDWNYSDCDVVWNYAD